MTRPNTSAERIDNLMALDKRVTPLLYERIGGEFRHRRMLRQGINLIATDLPRMGEREAGHRLHSFVLDQLGRSGLTLHAFEAWPAYGSKTAILPVAPQQIKRPLDDMANEYGDVKRRTINMLGKRERNSAHVVHLATLALPYAAEHYPHLDQAKIALYCWVHDILEAITGDIPSLGLSPEQHAEKEDRERLALAQFIATYHKQWPELTQLVNDYEHLVDPEARFVKSFDKLDPGFTHFANNGQQLREYYGYRGPDEFLVETRKTDAKMQAYATDFPTILEDREEFTQRIVEITRWADSSDG